VILHHRHYPCTGTADAEPLLLLHGLYGQSGNWGSHARTLAASHEVYALDARNHGQSAHSDTMSFDEMAADLLETMDALGLDSARLLGHSMGGKIVMTAALQAPERVARLVVVDIAPVAYARSESRELKGLCAMDIASIASRSEADEALSQWVSDKRVRDFLLTNLQNGPEGYRWRFNLPVLASSFAEITGWNSGEERYEGPVLFVKGSESDYIDDIHREAIMRQFPAAVLKQVEGAGHWVHSEQPEAFLALLRDFLD
jgi:esterase